MGVLGEDEEDEEDENISWGEVDGFSFLFMRILISFSS